MKPEDIRINQLVEIEVEGEGKPMASRVEEIKDSYLFVSMPMRKGALVPLWPGQEIRLIFRDQHSTVGAASKVVSRRREPLPYLIVNKPQKFFPINQKREFVRLPVTLTIRFRVLNAGAATAENPDGEIHQGTTIDISAGGLLFTTKALLIAGQILEMELKLSERESLYCKSNVVRIFARKHQSDDYKVALIYEDISEGQRDRIFKFIFDKQREWIKKGL